MLEGKKVIVVMPAYNMQKTFEKTYREIPSGVVDEVILVDDCSADNTVAQATRLGITTYRHEQNLGYGGNQKTCYREALKRGADIVVMLHPDYQYPPKLVPAMAGLISSGMFDIVLGSRILGGYALKGGMPFYKYVSNRFLTAVQNVLMGQKLSEYHTGYRAFSRKVLLSLALLENSDDFVFDNQILAQACFNQYAIGEISSPCSYTQESSSISFRRSVVYGVEVLRTALQYFLQKNNLAQFKIFDHTNGRRIEV